MALAISTIAAPARADQTPAFIEYLAGAEAAGLPVGYMYVAAKNLTTLEFTDVQGAVARYISLLGLFTTIRFDTSLQGAPGKVLSFDKIPTSQHATIFHEMWHCYFDTHERMQNTPFYQGFVARADALYSASPADKRVQIHEEAAAQMIERTITTFLMWAPIARSKGPWAREQWRQTKTLRDLWASYFDVGQYFGYYTTLDGEVWTPVSLEPQDIDLLAKHLLENLLSPDFDHSFSDDHLYPENKSPVAVCTDVELAEGGEALLDASKSYDPEGQPLELRWEQVAGDAVLPDGATKTAPSSEALLRFTPPKLGTYTFMLTLSDGVRLSAPHTVSVKVVEQGSQVEPDAGPVAGDASPSIDSVATDAGAADAAPTEQEPSGGCSAAGPGDRGYRWLLLLLLGWWRARSGGG